MREDRPSLPARPRALRTLDDRSVLEALLSSGPLPLDEVARGTGLSGVAAMRALGRLQAAHLVVRGAEAGTPRRDAWAPAARAALCAAVHVRPGRVRAQVVDATGGTVGSSDLRTGPEATPWWTVRTALSAACAGTGTSPEQVGHVVVGVGGAYDARRDVLANCEYLPGWTRPAVAAETGRRLGVDLHLENDVNLALVGEHAAAPGDGVTAEGGVLLWFGAGVGLAFDVDGTAYRGATGRAGELGYLPARGGRDGRTVENVLGGTALLGLAASYGLCPPDAGPDDPWGDCGPVLAQAARLARSQQRGAAGRTLLSDVADDVTDLLAPVVALLDPAVVALGGPGGTGGGPLLAMLVEDRLRSAGRWCGGVRPGALGADGVLTGGRLLALRRVRAHLLDLAAGQRQRVAT